MTFMSSVRNGSFWHDFGAKRDIVRALRESRRSRAPPDAFSCEWSDEYSVASWYIGPVRQRAAEASPSLVVSFTCGRIALVKDPLRIFVIYKASHHGRERTKNKPTCLSLSLSLRVSSFLQLYFHPLFRKFHNII